MPASSKLMVTRHTFSLSFGADRSETSKCSSGRLDVMTIYLAARRVMCESSRGRRQAFPFHSVALVVAMAA